MAAWVDMLALYSEMVMPTLNGDGESEGTAQAARSENQADIAYVVDSRASVYVHAELEAGAHKFELIAPGIRKSDGIRVRFDNEHKRRIVVNVRVKKSAKPGDYESNIVNSYNGEILGHLTIEVD